MDSIDLTVDSGEFFSLLGPSGCGKTTTLPLIAGFEQPTSGRILLDGTDMSGVPPHKRNVNTVFQSYALFPFLSVFDNVAFGLRYQKLARGEIATKVHGALDLVELGSYAKRRPAALSGGVPRRRHPGHAPPGARRPAPGSRRWCRTTVITPSTSPRAPRCTCTWPRTRCACCVAAPRTPPLSRMS